MPFTIEQIHSVLTSRKINWLYVDANLDTYLSSPNYTVVCDYLTGRIHSLGNAQFDYNTRLWVPLINLLENIESPSANDLLILDFVFNPQLVTHFQYYFSHWLLWYLSQNDNSLAFNAAKSLFIQMGMSDAEMFAYIIYLKTRWNDFDATEGCKMLKRFLIEYISQFPTLIYPKYGHLVSQEEFSLYYFKLLEEANPFFAKEYACFGALSNRRNEVVFFAEYRDGFYLESIIQSLQITNNESLHSARSKYSAALSLYEFNQTNFADLILSMSYLYLIIYERNPVINWWQNRFRLKEFANKIVEDITCSGCAFYFIFKHNKEDAVLILDRIINAGISLHEKDFLVFQYFLKEQAISYFAKALRKGDGGADYFRSLIYILTSKFEYAVYREMLWELVGNKSKSLRDIILKILVEKDPEAESKAIALLNNKKADIRQTAASILSYFPSEKATEAILQVLNKETNDNARDVLLQAVSESLPKAVAKGFVSQMITAAAERGKLAKPVESWLNETELPALFYTDGEQLSTDAIRFLLYRMTRVKTMQSDIEAKYLLQLLDKEKAASFAKTLIKLFIDKGAKTEHKYLLAIAALLGSDEVVDHIRRTTDRWIEESRYKMAEYGVGALAIQGINKALRWVEWYSRKYKSKKANVGAAALVALETAGNELGITIHELGDRIVPDFGFDGLFKEFTIGTDTYRAFIDSNFKIAFFNEDNKKLKALPAAADAELKEEFKNIAKEVRDIVRSQSSRLEYYLIIQRRWSLEQWQSFFLQNPVMFIYATKLLWAVYDSQANIIQTFVCNDDTTLLDINKDEIELPDSSNIGIVHPSQLDEATLTAWRKQFFDLSIDPIFPQLDRKLGTLSDIDLSKAIITKFDGLKTENESIRNTLDKRGWHKGPTGDGGMLDSYRLLYFEKKMEAVLEIDGVGAGYGWGGEEALGRLYFVDKSKLANKWFNHPQSDDDPQLIKLKDVPAIFLNEALAAVEAIKRKPKTA